MKVCIIYGGVSTEHDISIKSAKSIYENIDKDKYIVKRAFIKKDGNWLDEEENEIKNIIDYLKRFDVVFPVLHGLHGEDGTIQGLLEMINVPYVGCKVLASSIGMDKGYTNMIFDRLGIRQAKYLYIRKYPNTGYLFFDENHTEQSLNLEELKNMIIKKINKYPLFVKPSNSGSSVGVSKVDNEKELSDAIVYAFKFDNKILIEEGIVGKEVEVAILGNNNLGFEVSNVGEIKSAESFYSFNAKYENKESKVIIPANLNQDIVKEIQAIAKKAFKGIDGNGLARIDFFVEENTNKVYLNEINTMPGFTDISMYPLLMMNYGYTYSSLIDKLISLAIDNK